MEKLEEGNGKMINRIVLLFVVLVSAASAQTLPSWNEGDAKSRIVAFVQAVTDHEERLETRVRVRADVKEP
jgi:hypothetical protein